jgi:hypothetical protein
MQGACANKRQDSETRMDTEKIILAATIMFRNFSHRTRIIKYPEHRTRARTATTGSANKDYIFHMEPVDEHLSLGYNEDIDTLVVRWKDDT